MALKVTEDVVELTGKDIAKIIKDREAINNRYITLKNYYKAYHAVLDRRITDPARPNNKLVNNFPGYITDVNVGYFMGKPVTYAPVEGAEKVKEEIQNVFDYNDEQAENAQLAKTASIKGTAYELLYVDEDANARFNIVEPDNMILVYDDKITPSPLYALRYQIKDKMTYAELYTKEEIIQFEGEGDELNEVGRDSHPFLEVPVVEYPNNDEAQGDFEKVLTLVDGYDKSQSDTANDFEYFADAYLKIKNMSGTNGDDVADMKAKRVILVEGDGDADWLTKTIQDTAMENYKTRLQTDIHTFSMTPNLTDESFAGNLSGIALQFKLWGLEQVASQKERKFKRALQRRIELLCNFLGFKNKEIDWRSLDITFTRNIPMNLTDAVKTVVDLNGILSQETLLAQLPFISDPTKEMERIKAEQIEDVDLDEPIGDDEAIELTDEGTPEEANAV